MSSLTKSYCCPICEGKIDLEHYAFVKEVLGDQEKMKGWMDKTYTFELWKKKHEDEVIIDAGEGPVRGTGWRYWMDKT